MADRSAIEWTDATWNPWRGCDKVSPGCAHCYMFRDQERYGRDPSTVVRAADPTFYAPTASAKWARARDAAIAERGRHLVFTCSWSDWFHPAADEWREEAWWLIRNTPASTYQILTKRRECLVKAEKRDARERTERFIRLREEGLLNYEIAEREGCDAQAVASALYKARRYGLTVPPSPYGPAAAKRAT